MKPEELQESAFQTAARRPRGIVREYLDLMRYHKRYWLAPIIVVLSLIGAVLIIGGTAVAPLIYAIF